MQTKNIMIVGVGGQGSLLASKLLGRLLLTKGYDIKVSEVHGMSQRGGSVVTYVRYGDKVYSPVIDKGQADCIVSFELLEAARWTEYLKPGGKIVVNTQQISPMPVITGAVEYPQGLINSGQKPRYKHSGTILSARTGSTSLTASFTCCHASLVSLEAQLHNLFLEIFIRACALADMSISFKAP